MAGTLELIQALPAELREKICTEYIVIRLRERAELGWEEVNKVIKKAPVSNEQIEMKPFCYKVLCLYPEESPCVKCRGNSHGINPRLHYFPPIEWDEIDEYITFDEIYKREEKEYQAMLEGLDLN